MKETKFKAIPSAGTYFQLLDYSAISDENDVNFAEWLTKEKKVASVPVSVFYHEKTDHKVLRFCFAKENEELENAAEFLQKL
jgi:methionine aminotransferase